MWDLARCVILWDVRLCEIAHCSSAMKDGVICPPCVVTHCGKISYNFLWDNVTINNMVGSQECYLGCDSADSRFKVNDELV